MGNYELTLKKFSETENNLFGVFVSHSNADEDSDLLRDLNVFAKSESIHLVYDREFLEAGDDFRKEILRYANCYAAIVLLTENSIKSAWVNYEIGILNSRKIPLFIYDPNNILIKPDYQYDHQIKQFLPAFNNKEDLIKKIKELSVFSGLYPVGTKRMSISAFNDYFNSNDKSNKFEKCMLTLKSDVFDEYKEWFDRCRIGALISRFGQLDEYDSYCPTTKDARCPKCNNNPCALQQITSVEQCESGICTILNNIIYTGRIIYKGEKDIFDKDAEVATTAILKLGFPVHSRYGVKMKLIFDAETEKVKNYAIAALTKMQLDPTSSTTGDTSRIYCSIGENKNNGIFVIKKSFNDNFICPLVCFKD